METPVHGSNYIQSIGYLPEHETLILIFTPQGGGATMAYKGISEDFFLSLLYHKDPGMHWRRERENYGNYEFIENQ